MQKLIIITTALVVFGCSSNESKLKDAISEELKKENLSTESLKIIEVKEDNLKNYYYSEIARVNSNISSLLDMARNPYISDSEIEKNKSERITYAKINDDLDKVISDHPEYQNTKVYHVNFSSISGNRWKWFDKDYKPLKKY